MKGRFRRGPTSGSLLWRRGFYRFVALLVVLWFLGVVVFLMRAPSSSSPSSTSSPLSSSSTPSRVSTKFLTRVERQEEVIIGKTGDGAEDAMIEDTQEEVKRIIQQRIKVEEVDNREEVPNQEGSQAGQDELENPEYGTERVSEENIKEETIDIGTEGRKEPATTSQTADSESENEEAEDPEAEVDAVNEETGDEGEEESDLSVDDIDRPSQPIDAHQRPSAIVEKSEPREESLTPKVTPKANPNAAEVHQEEPDQQAGLKRFKESRPRVSPIGFDPWGRMSKTKKKAHDEHRIREKGRNKAGILDVVKEVAAQAKPALPPPRHRRIGKEL